MDDQKLAALFIVGTIIVVGAMLDSLSSSSDAKHYRKQAIMARKNLFLLMINQVIRTIITLEYEQHEDLLERTFERMNVIADYRDEEDKYEGYREIYRELELVIRESFFHCGAFKSLEQVTAEAKEMGPPQLYNLLSDMGHISREGLVR